MSFADLQEYVYKHFAPIFVLEATLDTPVRRRISRVIAVAFFVTVLLGGIAIVFPSVSPFITSFETLWVGSSLVLCSVWMIFALLEWFRRSYYYRGLDFVLEELESHASTSVSFEVGSITYSTNPYDVTEGFLTSYFGGVILTRLGVRDEAREQFLQGHREHLSGGALTFYGDGPVTISKYAAAIYRADNSLQEFLFKEEVQESDFLGTSLWVEEIFRERRLRQRWWGRDNLGRFPAIGRSLGYGQTYFLDKYGHDIVTDVVYESSQFAWREREEVDKLETILARNRQSNVLLVGEPGIGEMEIIARIARRIREGSALPPLMDKTVFIVNPTAMVEVGKASGAFEHEFIKILDQSAYAGNIILVIQNVTAFMEATKAIGVDVIDLMTPYFSSKDLQIIFTDDPQAYHHTLEKHGTIMQFFDTVYVEDLDEYMLVRVLGRESLILEEKHNVFFTYQAILEIIRSADRYFANGVMPDKGFDLMRELVASAVANKQEYILQKDVLTLVEGKTGIPLSAPTKDEQKMLIDLEKRLHEKIIGQVEAVSAIAKAMRRSRAGVRNMERPMGSFLFLGPTGVGKTETTKALAEVFFGNKEKIMRFDMSEYRGADALDRLIGSFQSGKAGTLSSALREGQYGILLLDEFEKTNPDVHDLFLQILDEGQFSDAHGKRVNARNVIVIATSNAASDKIWEYAKSNTDPSLHADDLTNEIIKRGIFKPELLNRFDGVIVFHPLSIEDIRKIAGLMLTKLKKRLREQGVNLEVSDAMLETIVKEGYDPQFGARPMNRAIQELIEQKVADKLIAGEVRRGQTITI